MFLVEHDLRANASRLSRGKTPAHFSGSCSSYGIANGGVSTIGGRGRGLSAAEPGAGLTSIGGGSGAICWLTTGGASAGGCGATSLGFGATRRGSRAASGGG